MEQETENDDDSEEIGVMEKGGRLQFVRATGTDIRSRSPTPISSENESEKAVNGGGLKQGNLLQKDVEQDNLQEDEASYSQGSDQFDKDSDLGGDEDGHGVQFQFNTSQNVFVKTKLSIAGGSGSNLQPGGSPTSNEVKISNTDHLEHTSPPGSASRVSGLSVASQTDIDKCDQLNQPFIEDIAVDLHKDAPGEDDIQQSDGKQIETNEANEKEEDNYSLSNFEQEQDNSATDSSTKPLTAKPPTNVIKIDNVPVEQKTQERPKTANTKKSADISLFMSEAEQFEDRQRSNDIAFMSWLKNKNKEVRKKHKEAFIYSVSEEEKEEKRRMCDRAYKAWLVKKSKEEKEKMRNEKLQSTEMLQEKRSSAELSFEEWLQNKVSQRKREAKRAEQEQQEQAEAARIVDRSISREAYKKWVVVVLSFYMCAL